MAKRLTRRQRLKRDPANQRLQKVVAWARKPGGRYWCGQLVEAIAIPGLIRPPRIVLAAIRRGSSRRGQSA